MFTMKDMLYYTMPAPTPITAVDKLFVTDAAYDRNSHVVGTIVQIKEGYTVLNGKVWRTSEDGTYVTGHDLGRPFGYGQHVVGTVDGDDDKFFLGFFREMDRHGKMAMISDVYNSRAEYILPSMEGYYANRVRLNHWTPAAPWATVLMPRPGDNHGTITAKLELAKAKWEMNRAVLEMAHEGYQRGWTDELKELHGNSDLDFLPRPRLGVMLNGDVLLPSGERRPSLDSMSAEQQAKITAIRSKSTIAGAVQDPRIPVTVALPLSLQLDPEEMDIVATTHAVRAKAREVLDDPDITLGSHSLSYFVNGLSSLI